MAQVTLDGMEVQSALLSLLKRLASALLWVREENRKEFRIDVPDSLGRKPIGNCISPVRPWERAEAEILLGILKGMKKKGPLRPKSKRRT